MIYESFEGLTEYITGNKLAIFVFLMAFAYAAARIAERATHNKSSETMPSNNKSRAEGGIHSTSDGRFHFGKDDRILSVYAIVMSLVLVCPLTASLLRLYATRHTPYVMLWAALPVVIFTAYFLTGVIAYAARHRGKALILPSIVAVCMLLLCTNLGVPNVSYTAQTASETTEYDELISYMSDNGLTEGTVWAPSDVITYIRAYAPEYSVLYGRNMWEESLNAYTYDTYSDDLAELYEYMEDFQSNALTAAYTSGDENETAPEAYSEAYSEALSMCKSAVGQGCDIITFRTSTKSSDSDACTQKTIAQSLASDCGMQAYTFGEWIVLAFN